MIFFTQIMLLIIAGRLLGEGMQRLGQPAVIGQLLGGILLGPTVFGTIWPAAQMAIFPLHASERPMLSAVSELGVLMLLLLTGMETDLALVQRVRRTAIITSAAGIAIPFVCGYGLGQILPADVLPDPHRRLITSLFLATALSISSVKIVAAVLREVDFLRRNLGQVILAAAILDDTIGWTLLAFIGGLAAQGKIVLGPVLTSIVGTITFLFFCFTLGRRWVARAIRWTNDHFTIEMPVISAILVLMIALALLTSWIGVHTVLGAFAAGVMVGQSPILTKHIEEELRGLIVALFMPVFFGVAGLSIDLKVLADPRLLGLAALLIGFACLGKLGGCYLGGRLGRLNHSEALAVGFAMNARGSTEVILATIGLSIGVLNQTLFTLIVLMAVVTTLGMPPLLRWALARVPMPEAEKKRLEAEAAEEKDTMPKLERVLVALDGQASAEFTCRLAGWIIGARHLTATMIDIAGTEGKDASTSAQYLIAAAQAAADRVDTAAEKTRHEAGDKTSPVENATVGSDTQQLPIRDLITIQALKKRERMPGDPVADAILTEVENGYGLLFLQLGDRTEKSFSNFTATEETVARKFDGPLAILMKGNLPAGAPDRDLQKILVPTAGADYSRFGAELAVAIARGSGASLTAFHVSTPVFESELLRHAVALWHSSRAILQDIVALAKRESVPVTARTVKGAAKESLICEEAARGGYQLIVLGTKQRPANNKLHFGESVSAILEGAPCPVLIVRS
jgi:Kef-type K+ transport system membrane component KefB/nucleotide-binding universal stress UspA family protein